MSQLKVNSIVPVGGLPAGATGGGIIQIVKSEKTDVVSSTTLNSFTDLTGANVTITPSSNSNNCLWNEYFPPYYELSYSSWIEHCCK